MKRNEGLTIEDAQLLYQRGIAFPADGNKKECNPCLESEEKNNPLLWPLPIPPSLYLN